LDTSTSTRHGEEIKSYTKMRGLVSNLDEKGINNLIVRPPGYLAEISVEEKKNKAKGVLGNENETTKVKKKKI